MTKMRTTTTIVVLLSLAILLAKSLVDASQEAQLRRFLQSRAMRTLSSSTLGTSEPTGTAAAWADPATFAHLLELCKNTPSGGGGSKEADRLTGLPGQPPAGVDFAQYSGYVTVNEAHGRELFYYLAESPHDAASKPLVLWLNGGPGASSLGYGAMTELGPFRVNPDGKTLSRNKHAWNNLANVLFLESPAGVGFSFSRKASDYASVGDRRTAEDAYVFMVRWLERFPEYKGRDFYIAGESYGGHYVPELAAVVTLMNRFPFQPNHINLRGIFVGNPLLNNYLNAKGTLEFLWSHGVISDELWAAILARCTESKDPSCFKSAEFSFLEAYNGGSNINFYNIYAPVCLQSRNGTLYSSSNDMPGYDPCMDNYGLIYLNDFEVQKALHARTNTIWTPFNNEIFSAWKDAPVDMVPIIKRLIDHGLRVWIYSGDFDSVCSLPSTRYSVKDLNLSVTTKWRPWYTPDSEVGGYVQQYEQGFTLASVRGAGHEVPAFQPKRSLVLLYSFLKNMLPPADIPI